MHRSDPKKTPLRAVPSIHSPVAPPAPAIVPKAATSPPIVQLGKKGPAVIQFGSSSRDVLDVMGKPDRVEDHPENQIRVLHYGKLRLVFKNGRLIPGSGVSRGE